MLYIAQKKPLIFILLILFILLIPVYLFPQDKLLVFANRGLDYPKDVISTDAILYEEVQHEISFQLPYDSLLISANDYITISFTHFTDITAPTYITGYYSGTPVMTVDNDQRIVQITGINIVPGAWVRIYGITATNPPQAHFFGMSIIVSEDEDYQIIKNLAYLEAVPTNYQVRVSASIAPPVAALTIFGYSAPGTFVTIMENGTVIGTNVAASNGLFVKFINGLDPGSHDISLYGVDQTLLSTSIMSLSVNTPIYQETTVSDLLLSPTIQINNNQIDLSSADTLSADGSAIPDGNITVFTETPLKTYYATASAQGIWSVDIDDIDNYLPGDYRIYSFVHNNTGSQSIFSNSLQFTVYSSDAQDPGVNPDCDISYGDLNCDAIVNLTDFSVLMYYWGTNAAVADINSDGIVSLIDFSIMMYYWGTI